VGEEEWEAMTCKHEPKDQIAAFEHTCKHCGQNIEPAAHCKACDGTGWDYDKEDDCPKCNGSGVKRWRLLP